MQGIIQQITLQRFFALLVQLGGVKGTAAVAAAYFLHLDPFGGFHVSLQDAELAMALAVPTLLLDAALMLPPWEASWEAQQRSLAGAAAATQPGADGAAMPAPDAPLAQPAAAGPLAVARDAAALYQRIKARPNCLY